MNQKHKRAEKGQGLVEYALIMVLVAVVSIGVLAVLGPSVGNVFSNVSNTLGSVAGGGGPQDFGTTQWKNGWDTNTPISNYCASEGSGAGYNLYRVSASPDYYIASGYPWNDPAATFLNTGTCP